MASRLALALLLPAALVVAGCGGAPAQAPESASLAPADAVAYASITTDAGSAQWQKAAAVLERVPGVRDTVVEGIEQQLASEDLDWEDDVAPALGDEVVIVITADTRPVVLLEPDSVEKLDALLAHSSDRVVRGEVEGRVALAGSVADLEEYRAALERGSIEGDESFLAGVDALPEEALGIVWVDVAGLTDRLSPLLRRATADELDLGVEWLSAALSAEDDGLLVAVGAHAPGSGDTHYTPTLFRRVPADAVAAFSFGGTQGTLDRIQGQVDVGALARSLEKLTGVSVDGVLDALSGEGVLYVRSGGAALPEVTLALAPPDPDETWGTVDRLARRLASQGGIEVRTTLENGIEVSELQLDEVTVRYARLDADTIVVTTGAEALTLLAGDGPKLVDSEGYLRAAEDVGLEDRTRGFLYVDVDGLLPLVEQLAGGSIPTEVREGVGAIDSLIFQTSGEGDTALVSGFLRVP